MPIPIPGGLEGVGTGFEPLPAGIYLAEVSDGEEREAGPDAKYPGTTYVAWEFTIQDEEYQGRKAWLNTSFTERAKPLLKSFLLGVGYDEETMNANDFEVDIDEIVGRQIKLVLKIGTNPKTKEKNNSVARVLPLDEEESNLPS